MEEIILTSKILAQITELTADGANRQELAMAINVSPSTISRWVLGTEYPEAKIAYKAGKEAYALDLADKIMAEATAPLHADPKFANAEVQRRKLIVDTSKWIGSKLLPRFYGDNLKIDHKHSGEVVLSPLAQLRSLEAPKPAKRLTDGKKAKLAKGSVVDTPASATNDDVDAVSIDDCF